MDITHINNHHHKLPIINISNNNNNYTNTTNLEKGLRITMDDNHHNHHNIHHHQHQHHHHDHHHHHALPMHDQVWPTYHNIPTPHPSQPSIQLPTSSFTIKSSLQNQVIHEENEHDGLEEQEELGAMKEMMYWIAVMQPVDIDPSSIHKPKRKNIRISNDPQSVAARHRRERISEKIRILQRLVPGGIKMDTASMLDEAARYVKFLKRQIKQLQPGSSTDRHTPPPLPPSDWPPLPPSASVVGPTVGLGSSKVVLSRDNNHLHEGIMFHHRGN